MSEAAAGAPTADTPPADASKPDPQAKPPTGGNGDAQKTYTQSELEAMVTSRLSKQEKALRKAWDDERAESERKAKLSAEEQLKETLAEAARNREEAQRELQLAKRQVQLAGKVKDVDYALFKIGQAQDDYVRKDGTVDVDGFLKAFPDQALGKPGPAPTSPGGGADTAKPDMNKALRDAIARSH